MLYRWRIGFDSLQHTRRSDDRRIEKIFLGILYILHSRH